MTTDQEVRGSNPCKVTSNKSKQAVFTKTKKAIPKIRDGFFIIKKTRFIVLLSSFCLLTEPKHQVHLK